MNLRGFVTVYGRCDVKAFPNSVAGDGADKILVIEINFLAVVFDHQSSCNIAPSNRAMLHDHRPPVSDCGVIFCAPWPRCLLPRRLQ